MTYFMDILINNSWSRSICSCPGAIEICVCNYNIIMVYRYIKCRVIVITVRNIANLESLANKVSDRMCMRG